MTQVTIDQALQIAAGHQQANRLAEAQSIYRQILAQHPNHFEALKCLGLLAAHAGQNDLAIQLMSQLLALHPGYAWIHANLGEIYRRNKNYDHAIAQLRHALSLNPQDPVSHFNLGVALADNLQFDEAIASYSQAITLKPADLEARVNLGVALARRGRIDEALASYQQALQLRTNVPETWLNIGNALADKLLHHDAAAAYRKAIELRPTYLEALSGLANILKDLGQLDEAIATYRHALQLHPNSPIIHNNLGNALKDQGSLDEALACFDRAITLNPSDAAIHSNRILAIHYHPAFTAEKILAECRNWDRLHALPLRQSLPPHANDRSPGRRLKIGYVSADFREHSVSQFLKPLLAHHDHHHFEIFCYSANPRTDHQTKQIQQLADHWRNIAGLPDPQAADLIRQDKIDILIDLALHSAHNRLLVFARKPAPIQITWLGYASTTGLATIDYRLTDPYLDPVVRSNNATLPSDHCPLATDHYYSEQSIRLPHSFWCYQPMLQTVDVNPLPALSTGRITFACFNNFAKVTPQTQRLWARLLAAVPNSRLLIYTGHGSHRDAFRQRLADAAVSPDRLVFVLYQSLENYYRQYHDVDIALDPLPFGGGTTSCDALWMGVPLITLAGQTPVGRGGVSILSNLNLHDWIAHSPDQYLQIAQQKSANLPALAALRQSLRPRMQSSPLTNAPQFTTALESTYRQLWQSWCKFGVPPSSLEFSL